MKMYKVKFKKYRKDEWKLLPQEFVKNCGCSCHITFKHCVCDCSKFGLIGEYELEERGIFIKSKLEEYEVK